MSNDEIRNYAKTFAKEHLEGFEYLSIHEVLEFDGVEYEDDDAEKIFDLIIHADVTLPLDS